MTTLQHSANQSRKSGYYSAVCLAIAAATVAAVVVFAVHRGLWPPPDRSPQALTGRPG
jgi:hypothetical protein